MPAAFVISGESPGAPSGDIAIARQLMDTVSRSTEPVRIIRLYRPRPTVAMTARERNMPGFEKACAAASARGFVPVVRATGGRAVAYDETSLVVEVFDAEPAGGLRPDHRTIFRGFGDTFVRALRASSVDARLGPVPGEFCPGDYSVNARGVVKVVGTAQRVVRGARLIGASLALGPTESLRAVLDAVNSELGLEWNPDTLGSAGREAPSFSTAEFTGALIDELAPDGATPITVADAAATVNGLALLT